MIEFQLGTSTVIGGAPYLIHHVERVSSLLETALDVSVSSSISTDDAAEIGQSAGSSSKSILTGRVLVVFSVIIAVFLLLLFHICLFVSLEISLDTPRLVSAYAALYFTLSLADLLSFIFFFSWRLSSIACHLSGAIVSFFFTSLLHPQTGFTCFIKDVPHLLPLLIYSIFFFIALLVYVTQGAGLEPVPQLS